jgi:hypothetical protein
MTVAECGRAKCASRCKCYADRESGAAGACPNPDCFSAKTGLTYYSEQEICEYRSKLKYKRAGGDPSGIESVRGALYALSILIPPMLIVIGLFQGNDAFQLGIISIPLGVGGCVLLWHSKLLCCRGLSLDYCEFEFQHEPHYFQLLPVIRQAKETLPGCPLYIEELYHRVERGGRCGMLTDGILLYCLIAGEWRCIAMSR